MNSELQILEHSIRNDPKNPLLKDEIKKLKVIYNIKRLSLKYTLNSQKILKAKNFNGQPDYFVNKKFSTIFILKILKIIN